MKLLLDTHILLWALSSPNKLRKHEYREISKPENTIYVSSASTWEIAIKQNLGKLKVNFKLEKFEEIIEKSGFEQLPVKISHSIHTSSLPHHHNDSFDRLLIAQAKLENLTMITKDQKVLKYDGVKFLKE